MTSHEEREETLKTIREGGIARNEAEAYVLLLHCIGVRPQLPAVNTYKQALERLADLIDPVCHLVEINDDDGTEYTCSNYGNFGSKEVQLLDSFNYCPVRGARIVRNEREDNE